MPNKRVFLDYASITPPHGERKNFANPSALYKEGVAAASELAAARDRIAKILHAHSGEIIFTASGTEANNLALLGVFEKAQEIIKKPHFIISNIEHPSIIEVGKEIQRRGGEVTTVKVEENGIIDPKQIQKALKPNTVLVSVMYANNEIGTIQPIREIAKVIKKEKTAYPYFHTDSSQGAEYLDLNTERLGVDFLTLDGSKIYGPRGAGLLFARRRAKFYPIIFGGRQEGGRRAGTENVAAASSLAAALETSLKLQKKETVRLTKLRDHLISEVLKKIPTAFLNGDPINRLPNNINLCFSELDAELAVLRFDAKGIAISSVTSCRSHNEDSSSYVVSALGRPNCASSSLRISLGRYATRSEVDFCLKILYDVVNKWKS